MIFNMVGHGSSVNFTVVGGTAVPENPEENTIWVNTDAEVTGWIFSADDPFVGTIAESAGESLGAVENSTLGIRYTLEKANEGRAARLSGCVEIAGEKLFGTMLMARDKDACAILSTGTYTVNGNSAGTTTIEATDNFVYDGETFYYAYKFENYSVVDFSYMTYESYEELAQDLLTVYVGEGAVWFAVGMESPVAFNAVRKNTITVYPLAAYQNINGTRIQKTAQTYIDGAWVEWFTYLFNDGQVNETLTGGINGTIQDGAIYFNGSVNASYNQTYTTVNKMNLTNFNSLKAVISSQNTVEDVYFRLLVDDAQQTGSRVTLANLLAQKTIYSPFANEVREVTLDISELSGEYYVGYAWGVDSGASSAKTITGNIERWWLE